MKTQYILLIILLIFGHQSYSQVNRTDMVHGQVLEDSSSGNTDGEPLISANIHWLNSSVGTVTDENGQFEIAKSSNSNQLVISYTGYQSDTVNVDNNEPITIRLKSAVTLDEIKVTYRKKSTEISTINPLKMEQISEGELRKAACCNLSESFSTSPSVDVAFTDAVTGTRQIRMLGLASPYTNISQENMPGIRGLNAIQGLSFIPGPWVQDMQLSKGAGTVINGYQSIAGQINIELKKPEMAERLYVNLYANEEGRKEVNVNMAHDLNEKWSTGLLLHGNHNNSKSDRNDDAFLDHPIGQAFAALHRWKYRSGKNINAQFNIMGTTFEQTGGQMSFNPETPSGAGNYWGMTRQVNRVEGWGKIGWLSPLPWKSMGLQISASYHQEENRFGRKNYEGDQVSLYANYVFQSILWNTNHGIKTGASFQYDNFDEILGGQNFDKIEVVPGVYGEYNYKHNESFDVVTGLRIDHHNQHGAFVTPRIHVRYAPADGSVFRASAGRGFRTASMIAENFGLLASSREWIFEGTTNDYNHGLEPEIAWNYGLNFTQNFRLDYRDGTVSFDAYRTDFQNRVVVDLDANPQQALFYNLDGDSYSNVLQAQVDYELIHNLDLRLAYRWVDAKTTFQSGLKDQPLNARHRAFGNLGYTTRNEKWKMDLTLNWQGRKRLPSTASNPEEYQLADYSPSFYVINSQITHIFNRFEVYAGVENLLDRRQTNPILASGDPFGPYFDSSLAWGPVFGRNIYIGARYIIL